MGFNSLKDYVEAANDSGQTYFATFLKTANVQTTAGCWFDYTSGSGLPAANYYPSSPLTSALLGQKYGIYAGEAVAPKTKYISKIQASTQNGNSAPMSLMICDYLLYYPFIDMDETNEQVFTNSVSLPRYTDGSKVKAMLVAQGAYTGGATFTIKYTNELGVSGRVSRVCTSNTGTRAFSLITGNAIGGSATANVYGPFIPLQSGDFGIRSVQSITFSSPNGGIAALVLCVPIANGLINEVGTTHEKDFFKDGASLPVVADGAILGLIVNAATNMAANSMTGHLEFIWG